MVFARLCKDKDIGTLCVLDAYINQGGYGKVKCKGVQVERSDFPVLSYTAHYVTL